MDKIILEDLAFYGYHGALVEENELGQKFFIDLELGCDLEPAGKSDQLAKSVNYAQVYELVKEICQEEQFKLLEALAEEIAGTILEEFARVEEVTVRVEKPEAPIEGIFDHVGVEITRKWRMINDK